MQSIGSAMAFVASLYVSSVIIYDFLKHLMFWAKTEKSLRNLRFNVSKNYSPIFPFHPINHKAPMRNIVAMAREHKDG